MIKECKALNPDLGGKASSDMACVRSACRDLTGRLSMATLTILIAWRRPGFHRALLGASARDGTALRISGAAGA